MSTVTFLKRFARRTPRSRSAARRAQHRCQFRPFLEPLEDRRVLSTLFDFAMYIGGSETELGRSVAVDDNNNVFITGRTTSTDLPLAINAYGGNGDAFVAKIDSAGELIWTSYLGGSGPDYGSSIAIHADAENNMYVFVAGWTRSDEGDDEAFVTKMNSDGGVIWTAYVGGSDGDWARGIAIDGKNNVFVVGETRSDDLPNATNNYGGGNFDGFIAKIDSSGEVLWTTYVSGTGTDRLLGVAIDSENNVFATGFTFSDDLRDAINDSGGGDVDGFVAKIDSNAGGVDWTMYVGGSSFDYVWDIAIDDNDNLFVGGRTTSVDLPNATNNYLGDGTSFDAFVAKIDTDGPTVTWSTYVGGTGDHGVYGIAIDGQNNVIMAGYTSSDDLPNATNSFQGGEHDAFIANVAAEDGGLAWTMYLGGSASDRALGIVIDANDRILVTGQTESTDFAGANDELPGLASAFLVRVDPASVPPVALDDHYAVVSEQTLVVGASQGVLANDINPRPRPLTAVLVDPSYGQLTLSEDGSFVYTPAAGFAGDDTFTYKATDGDKQSNEATVTITVLVTKFYVVNDATVDQTYEYSATGELVESYGLSNGNTAPRGVASTVAGDKTWVVDANRKVYVYDTSGGLLGSWTAGTLASNATVEGIATNGTDIWIVDARSDKVFKYTNAASRLSGSQNAASSFSLNRYNRSPKDMVTDGTSIWVVNDTTTDKVFKYSMSGSLLGSWTISNGGGRPTGITIDPSNASQDIWIVDSQTNRVYQYTDARTRTSGSQSAAATFALAVGNGNPQGIADPPAPADMPVLSTRVNSAAAPAQSMLSRTLVGVLENSFARPIQVDFAPHSPITRIEWDALTPSRTQASDVFDGVDLLADANTRAADPLQVGFEDHSPAQAVDRLMALLGRRRTPTIEPLEDVLEELSDAEL